MSWLVRRPAWNKVSFSVQATCTYFQVPSTQAGVSSAPSTGARRSRRRTRSRNGSSRDAASPITVAIVPVEGRSRHRSAMVAAARPNGRNWAARRYTSRALTPGPYRTRPLTPAGAWPPVTAAQHGHTSDTTRYSVIFAFGGGGSSMTCRRCRENSGAPARSASHAPHSAGEHSTVESGSSTSRIVTPGAPNGLPRLPPDEPEDRFDLANPSCDGGFALLDEFVPRRRFNSVSSASSSIILAACAATSCASSSYDGRCGSASDIPKPCHTNRFRRSRHAQGLKLNTYDRVVRELRSIRSE